ncbi:MAG: GNAT family N-acetyltransferase [Sterolibacteriaceae bacterium MAG5]|nr:GNAT family N-acetyltransferase [Candidatus Nitricoxidireducens bremensis]
MSSSALTIRTMSHREIGLALDWAAAEGWNPGLHDAAPFHAADGEGFLVGLIDGEPVATISAVRYGDSFGFIGFYIVKPSHRGRGHGWAIWQAAMARLAGRCVGLDGVLAQQENYRRSGFRFAHRNVRYQRNGGSPPTPLLPDGTSLVPLFSLPWPSLESYDASFFPTGRSAFLRNWIAQPQTVALGLVDGSRLLGYGTLRLCRSGAKVGPLFADTPQAADALFSALCAAAPSAQPVFLDVPECNAKAVALAESHGMSVMFETARMYTGHAPRLAMDSTYGITSFELG